MDPNQTTPPPPLNIVLILGGNAEEKERFATLLASESPELKPAVTDRFETEPRERVHAAFKLFGADGLPVGPLAFRGVENEASKYLNGHSPNEVYTLFDTFLRKVYKKGFRGKWVAERIRYFQALWLKRNPERLPKSVIIMDSGREDADYAALVKEFGLSNITVFKLHRRDVNVLIPPSLLDHIVLDISDLSESLTLEAAARERLPFYFPAAKTEN